MSSDDFSRYGAVALKCLDEYDFGDGLTLTERTEWGDQVSSISTTPVLDVGALRLSCRVFLLSDESQLPVEGEFWVIFDVDQETGEPSAMESGTSRLLGKPVGLPRYFRTRVVIDVLTYARPSDIGSLVPTEPSDVIDCAHAYMDDGLREEWKTCVCSVDMKEWKEVSEADASIFASALDESLECCFGNLKNALTD